MRVPRYETQTLPKAGCGDYYSGSIASQSDKAMHQPFLLPFLKRAPFKFAATPQ